MINNYLPILFVMCVSDEVAKASNGDTTLEMDATELLIVFGHDIHEYKGGE